jgi:hypothetical protein
MSYISLALRQFVINRANARCEYCLFPQFASLFTFEIEHIIAEKHDGSSEANNLALACPHCNQFKGTDLGSLDPATQQLTPFFHPRLQQSHSCKKKFDNAHERQVRLRLKQ